MPDLNAALPGPPPARRTGGPQTYAAYLTDSQGYEVELVAGLP
ncbi:hypothetical protein [Micromonospora phytophila]|nr:hypothetical protein [Micromonospora phytophila]